MSLGRESSDQVEISEAFLAELLSMARKPARSKQPKAKPCPHCGGKPAPGFRGLCYEGWKMFRRDKARVGAAIKKLTPKEIRDGLTLDQKRKDAMAAWDRAQVALGNIREGHRGFQHGPTFTTRTA